MAFDSVYLAVMALSAVLALGAQAWVMSAVHRYKDAPTGHGLRGVDVAALILNQAGISGVRIEEVGGFLSDHYDPSAKVLRLSPENFRGRSIAAAGIAAHEVGHALQHAHGYWPMRLRQTMVPIANVGTNLGVILATLGIALGAVGLAKIGVVLFAGFVGFTLITLPVELDASARAKRALKHLGILNESELRGVATVLRAAAATYVAAAATALLQLIYFLLRVGTGGGREREA